MAREWMMPEPECEGPLLEPSPSATLSERPRPIHPDNETLNIKEGKGKREMEDEVMRGGV